MVSGRIDIGPMLEVEMAKDEMVEDEVNTNHFKHCELRNTFQ